MLQAAVFAAAAALLFCCSRPAAADERQFLDLLQKGKGKADAGDLKSAIDVYTAAMKEAAGRGDIMGVGLSCNILGGMYNNTGDFKSAVASLNDALKYNKEVGNPRNILISYNTLCVVYKNIGDIPTAVDYCTQGLAKSTEFRDKDEEFEFLNMMALLYTGIGDYSNALKYVKRGFMISAGGGDKRRQADALIDFEMVYNEIGDYDSALDYLKRAEDLISKNGIDSLLARLNDERGIVYTNLGEYDKALTGFSESVVLQKKEGGWAAGGTEINMADAYMAKGDPRACDMYHKLGHWIGEVRCLLVRKDYKGAVALLDKRMPGITRSRGSNTLLAGLSAYGLSYEFLGDYPAAEKYYRQGLDFIEQSRANLADSPRLYYLSGQDWLFPRLESHEGLVRVSSFTAGGLRESFHYSEFTKGRLFTELAAKRSDGAESRIPAALSKEEDAANLRAFMAQKRAQAMYLLGEKAEYSKAEAENSAAIRAREEFIGRLRKDYPAYASVIYPLPVYPEGVRLAPDEALIEYEVTGPYTKVFLVKNGAIVFSADIRLNRRRLTDLVRKYRDLFENVDSYSKLGAYDPSLGKKLYGLLLAPVLEAKDAAGRPLVGASDKLVIVPDEILGVLPFDSLVISAPEKADMPSSRFGPVPVGVEYVADKYDIAYAYSAASLHSGAIEAPAGGGKELFVLADPVFSAADSRLRGRAGKAEIAAASKMAGAVLRRMGISGVRGGAADVRKIGDEKGIFFPRLDKTGLLADELASVFPGSSTVLAGLSASEESLLGADLSGYRFVVLATHGILEKTIPQIREPALVLSQFGNRGGRDGFLTLSKVMRLKLNADLVALPACQTSLGKSISGEGVMSLGRAFQYAGARAVLATLWSVNEDSTTHFTEKMLRYIKEGRTRREALKLARRDIRKEGYEHPFFWAPFVLSE